MRATFFAVTILAALPAFAQAKTLNFPSDKPIASITMPDSWNPEETSEGVQGVSDDGAIYFSADISNGKDIEKVTTDAITFLEKNGVKINDKTVKKGKPQTINGMQVVTLDWDGEDENGAVSVGLAFAVASSDRALVLTYWGDKESEDEHQKEIGEIFSSIRLLK